MALSLRRELFGLTVGLEGGAENVGLAESGRTPDNRAQETGRDFRAEKLSLSLSGMCQGGSRLEECLCSRATPIGVGTALC